MFTQTTITINEGVGLARLISAIKKGFGILPFKLNHRLNRQLAKLTESEKSMQEAQTSILKGMLGEEKFEELAKDNTPIATALKETELKDFNELLLKELEGEITVGLLSESFEDLIGNPDLEASVGDNLSGLISFFEEKVWNKTENA